MTVPGFQRRDERAAFSLRAFRPHRAAVEMDQFLHQSQSDARAFVRAGARSFHLMKTLEQTRQIRRRNSNAGVRHIKFNVIAAPPERNADAAGERVLERIRDQVKHDLLPHITIHEHRFGQCRAIHRQRESG